MVLSVKQVGIKYHFLSLWYDSTWDWTPVSWAIGEDNHQYLKPHNCYLVIGYLQLIKKDITDFGIK